jgi:hypothetical protein
VTDITPIKPAEPTEEQKQYIITQKFEDWVAAFIDKKSPTYGNATQSAIKAYNLDPVKQYGSAAQIGLANVKKHKGLAMQYAESRGLTYGSILDIQITKATDSKAKDQKAWFDDLKEDLGYREPRGAQVIIQNTQNNANIDLNAPEAKDFNKEFKKFLYQDK